MNFDDYTEGMGYVMLIDVDRTLMTTNVPASTLLPWNAGTTYALNAEVIDTTTRVVYRSMVAGNTGNPTSDSTKWQDRGVENRYALVDGSLGTITSNPDLIEIVYPPGQVVSDVAFFNLKAHAVQVLMHQDAELLFDSEDVAAMKPSGNSHWGYFFEPLEGEDRLLVSGLPAYTQATLTIRIKAPGGIASCGVVAFGRMVWLGNTYWRPTISFDEWGEKSRDKWGGWMVTQDAPYSDRMELQVLVEGQQYQRTKQRVLQVRGTPVVWVGALGMSSMMVYGYIESFRQIYVSLESSDCQMVIQGLEVSK